MGGDFSWAADASMIDPMETVDGWEVRVGGGATATITTTSGYSGTAIQLSYNLGITPATGSWAQIVRFFNPLLDLSDADYLRLYYKGTMTNTLEAGLVLVSNTQESFYPFYGWGNGLHGAAYSPGWISATWDFRALTPPLTDLSKVDGIFISVANQDGDLGGMGILTVDELQYFDVPPPTLTRPANGMVISDMTPTLIWAASPSPDVAGYLLNLDGVIADVGNVTTHTTGILAGGIHTWTVAAYDLVGNYSQYASPWTLYTKWRVFLPLIMKSHSAGLPSHADYHNDRTTTK